MNKDPMEYVGITVAILGIVWFVSMLWNATYV
mgnify:CR=1 FL=1|jgi:hypothetical protein